MARLLMPGDTVPWFNAPAVGGNPNYIFSSAAGRAVMLLFAGPLGSAEATTALAQIEAGRAALDDIGACFFGFVHDPADVVAGRVRQRLPGIRWLMDPDEAIARRFGAVEGEGAGRRYHPHWLLLDATLRVVMRGPLDQGATMFRGLRQLVEEQKEDRPAPVLVVPRVFDRALCRRLIDLYDAEGGQDSGFMRDVGGTTVGMIDHSSKRRSDHTVVDEDLRKEIRGRIGRFLLPQVKRAFHFEVTRIERYLVARYEAENGGGFFAAHRDNTTLATAHRRFACTINLDAEAYDGGDLRFPEYGSRTYRAPTGGAVIFSCSLLHEALPVTRGVRYAYLPFLYDEAGAAVREKNSAHLGPELGGYRAAGAG